MLSFDERELGRQMGQLAATIVVPPAPPIGTRGLVPLWPVLASLAIAVLVVVIVGRPATRGGDTLSPSSPAPGATVTPSPSPSPSPASPTPSHRATPYPGLPGPTFLATPGVARTITGTITELGLQGQQPVAGARIDVYLYGSGGRSGHWMSDVTGADGRYELWGIFTNAIAVLYASKGNYLQPCVHQVTVTNDMSLDIEIVQRTAGTEANAAARRGTGPFLTGVVFEQLADGTRVPIPDAMVWIGGDMTPLGATTITDPDGRYLVCGVPLGSNEFAVTATGFRQNPTREIVVSADMTLDVQMKR